MTCGYIQEYDQHMYGVQQRESLNYNAYTADRIFEWNFYQLASGWIDLGAVLWWSQRAEKCLFQW